MHPQKQPSRAVLGKSCFEDMHQFTVEHPCRSVISTKLPCNNTISSHVSNKYVCLGYVSRDTSPIIGQRKLLCRVYLQEICGPELYCIRNNDQTAEKKKKIFTYCFATLFKSHFGISVLLEIAAYSQNTFL